jgi:hypothetical protein
VVADGDMEFSRPNRDKAKSMFVTLQKSDKRHLVRSCNVCLSDHCLKDSCFAIIIHICGLSSICVCSGEDATSSPKCAWLEFQSFIKSLIVLVSFGVSR